MTECGAIFGLIANEISNNGVIMFAKIPPVDVIVIFLKMGGKLISIVVWMHLSLQFKAL